MFKLYKYIKENEITYVMSFLWKSDFIGAFMKLLIGKKIKLFISERGDRLIRNKLHQKAYKIKNCIDKFFIFKYSDYLITNSVKTKYFLYKMGLDTKKFVYLPNLVADINDINKKHKNEIVTFGYVGRLDVEKNPILAIDYLKKYDKPSSKLIFFGEGRLLASLIEYAKQLKLENQVEFRGYAINKSDIYNNIDILINTSKIECSSNSCLEALTCGLKVVSTRTFSYYELKQYFFTNIIVMNSEIKELRVNSSTLDLKYKRMSQLKMKSFIDEYLN
jgi:glycosyltransferase involved in cell wall biosynthesis